jgi:hypothetical protein
VGADDDSDVTTIAARWLARTLTPEYAGTDFLVARDGKIAAVYMFFDELT